MFATTVRDKCKMLTNKMTFYYFIFTYWYSLTYLLKYSLSYLLID